MYVCIYIFSYETIQLIAREIRNTLQFKYFTGQQEKDSDFEHVDAPWR